MKKYIKSHKPPQYDIYAGVVVKNSGTIKFNFKSDDYENDIIHIYNDVSSEFNEDNVRYIYAYTYTDNALESDKRIFRKFIKDLDKSKSNYMDKINEFIDIGVLRIEKYCSFKDFGAVVHIQSKRNSLVNAIGSYIDEYVEGDHISFELVKRTYNDVQFDENKAREALTARRYSKDRIDEMISKLKSSFDELKQSGKLFEMKNFLPREIRSGFLNFLKFKNDEERETYLSLQGINVLIYDDFLTSGTTIKEIIRCLRSIHNKNTLTVFVLLKQ